MIPRRTNVCRKVVSRFDPAWRQLLTKRGAYGDYCNTLEIEALGDLSGLSEPFEIFDIMPLRVQYEMYVDGKNSNWWEIFRTHVKSISSIPLEMDGDRIKDSIRDILGFAYIEDIARMIVDLANIDGKTVFFMPPDGYGDFLLTCQRRLAKEAEQAVHSAAAKNNG